MNRRNFMETAATAIAFGAGTTEGYAQVRMAQASSAATPGPLDGGDLDPQAPEPPKPDGLPSPSAKRWYEQRWLIDSIIRANGIEWDQPRMQILAAVLGPDAGSDLMMIRQRVQKLANITPAFETAARRRERLAAEFERGGNVTDARANYLMAANYYASAQWPIDENNEKNISLNQRKRANYLNYARLADHRVVPAWIPVAGKLLPAWFHLPYGYQGGRVPCVVSIPGMDSCKEIAVSLTGDRFLSRGVAVLAVDGPGQYESAIYGNRVSVSSWQATGPALFNWLAARPEIDQTKIAITGVSFGSFFVTIAAAEEPRYAAVAAVCTCFEPGGRTIFEAASPTFKKRFMYMSGIADEQQFDKFRETLTLKGRVAKITAPYLCLAGEADELCPTENTDAVFAELKAPKRLVVYADAPHAIGGVQSASLGPPFFQLQAEWLMDRFAQKPFASERWFVDGTGQITKTPFA